MSKKLSVLILLLVLAVVPMGIMPGTIDLSKVQQYVLAHSVRVASISIYIDQFDQETKGMASGSGVIIDYDKILTCAHIANDKPKGKILAQVGNEVLELTILKYDVAADLLLLQAPKVISTDPVRLAEGYSYGEEVMFIGYTKLQLPTLRFDRLTYRDSLIMIHPAYYGDSGGPVFNMQGELVGIIQTQLITNDYQDTLWGSAIPLEKIKEFLSEKIQT